MTSEEIRPLGSRVLIRLLEEQSVTSTGLVIPDTAKDRPHRGEVVAVGDDPDVTKIDVGDVVLFADYTGTEMRLNGADHLILDADDILAIVTSPAVTSTAATPAP